MVTYILRLTHASVGSPCGRITHLQVPGTPAQTGKTQAVSNLGLSTCPKVLSKAELSRVGQEWGRC